MLSINEGLNRIAPGVACRAEWMSATNADLINWRFRRHPALRFSRILDRRDRKRPTGQEARTVQNAPQRECLLDPHSLDRLSCMAPRFTSQIRLSSTSGTARPECGNCPICSLRLVRRSMTRSRRVSSRVRCTQIRTDEVTNGRV